MGHDHDHGHTHEHGHHHDHDHSGHGHHHHHEEISESEAVVVDLGIPDKELSPHQLGRRGFLRAAGVLGAGAATASLVTASGVATAAAEEADSSGRGTNNKAPKVWLAGDHHIHTRYSSDGMYLVEDQVQHGVAYGLDWMVITDHGSEQHVRIGVENVNPEIQASRKRHPNAFIFQGLEWNIPAAEHGTVIVHPGQHEVSVMRRFEEGFDGRVRSATGNTPANEALARDGIMFLSDSVKRKQIDDALFLANHPARNGIDSPHEVRGWRDTDPSIAVGWEGAPGHQAAGISTTQLGPGSARGYYGNAPGANSFAGYPLESYRTWGGFDFYTATVGGLWDSMLAEGKHWGISANSDSHSNYLDTAQRGAGSDFNAKGFYNAPEYSGSPNTSAGDYWPGFYSRTVVGANKASYANVMTGLRNHCVWVDHGRLLESLDVRVRLNNQEAHLGGVLTARRGQRAQLVVRIVPAQFPNWATFVPKLAKVDVIQGRVTGPVSDADTLHTPETKVVQTWDVTGRTDVIELTYDLGEVGDTGFYVRLRGSDGKRTQAGFYGSSVDATGPAIDVVGDANPWQDLWFYTNAIFVLPRR
ncbi:PHP domain-containing protein [Propioniciclava soli]|uniref:Histidinol-phosphatase n=1 Tax=Propioniciclava soli TaxID=2775081 RepID=A0ABZ3C6F5_9ACTN|nr:PHP domain-containing protein [Propioniciclava soli]